MVFLDEMFKIKDVSLANVHLHTLSPVSVSWVFPPHYVANPDNDTFAIINTQLNNTQGKHCIFVATFYGEMCFANRLARRKYYFLKQHCKQIMPAQL